MKNFRKILLLIVVLWLNNGYAQNKRNTVSGSIEYEKSINVFAIAKRQINNKNESFLKPAFEQFQKTNPQFKKLKSQLLFSKNETLFIPIDNIDFNISGVFSIPLAAQNNIVFTDFSKQMSICQKKVFDKTYLINESLRHIKWKITDETREIAGYNCRRANALVLDSIYVVAFYADDIPVSAGPESFGGLPGMILGLAIPHENISWFATKIEDYSEIPIKVPTTGTFITPKELQIKLKELAGNWGVYANETLISLSL